MTDDAGNPVAGALVMFIEQETAGRSHVTATNDEGFYQIDLTAPTTIADESSVLPGKTRLLPNYPNPFNPATLIPYILSQDGPVTLTIYNVLGQPMRTLVNSMQPAGEHSARWDGRTDGGQAVATGVYLAQLRTADAVETRKMVLLDGAGGRNPIAIDFTAVQKTAGINQLGDRLFTVEISSGDLLLYRQRGLSLAADNVLDFQVPQLQAQTTLEGSFRISTAEKLDELLQPTLNRPFRIAGSLILRRSDLVDLAALSNLESVGGNLTLFGNMDLESLTGLENLLSVGGRLRITANGSLKTLDGLGGLQMVGGNLELNSNQSLTSLEGISHLFPTFTGDLSFSLSRVTGLEPLRRLPADIVGHLTFYLREAPETLEILSHVETISGSLVLAENYVVDSLEGLRNLRHLSGSLILHDNRRMKTLDGLQSLATIGGGLSVSRDRTLETLHGLKGIREMGGSLALFAADSLAELNGLEQLTRIGGDLLILFNGGLRSLDRLENLRHLEGNVQIISNRRLGSIAALGQMLDTFDGRLILEFTPALVELDVLSTVEHLRGSLVISGAEAPSNLAFLRNLRRVDGDLGITSARVLQELPAFPSSAWWAAISRSRTMVRFGICPGLGLWQASAEDSRSSTTGN